MHRKEAGEILHDVNAINAIKIAGSDIAARVGTLMDIIMQANIYFSVSELQP